MHSSTDCNALTLRQRLRLAHLARRPDTGTRRLRADLARFLQRIEPQIFEAPPELAAKIRALLGWDDATLADFIDAPLVTHSSPHASMNLFAPNLAQPWMHATIRRLNPVPEGRAIHLRTLVMHNNLGDLRFKPYALWHRDRSGRCVQTALFSRGHHTRHKLLLSRATPAHLGEVLAGVDREAFGLAAHARNYAHACMIYRAAVERAGGLHEPGGVVEVPFHLLAQWTFANEDLHDFARAFASVSPGVIRTMTEDGTLREVPPAELGDLQARAREDPSVYPLVCPNYMNFALVDRLGIAVTSGGKRMASYCEEMHRALATFYASVGEAHTLPGFVALSRLPADVLAPVDRETEQLLLSSGITYALAIAVADHGASGGPRLDALLDGPYAEVSVDAA